MEFFSHEQLRDWKGSIQGFFNFVHLFCLIWTSVKICMSLRTYIPSLRSIKLLMILHLNTYCGEDPFVLCFY